MKIGFLNNQIDNRGTGNALFDYAHYNEELLGNESVIMTLDTQQRDPLMEKRLVDRFKFIWPYQYSVFNDIDVVYHIKSGADITPQAIKGPRYVTHGVFDCPTDGDRRAVVSYWLSGKCIVPCVPHIVTLPQTELSLRDSLGISKDAVVLGRYGGSDSFDLPFVWDAIGSALDKRSDLFFLFANTDGIPHEIKNSGRVAYGPAMGDPVDKRIFINSCDGMIHARNRGETFGISVGEFATCGKPVITYGGSYETAHLLELPYAQVYFDKETLVDILLDFKPYYVRGYVEYTPKSVMNIFKEVFLD